MKKVLLAVFVCLLALLTLTACKGKKTEATKAVEAMIAEIGDVTVDSADALAEIQRAYAALSADEKERVKNYDKLQKALETLKAEQNRFASYDEMNDLIADVIEIAGSKYSKDGTDFSGLIERGNALLEQYNDLDEEGKAKVQITDEFKSALEAISEMAEGTEASAAEYVKAFNSVYADKNYEITAVYCIKQLREDTQYHIFALTYKDADGAEHNLYANARCSSNTKAEVIANNADTFFADAAVSETYDAILNGNVTLDLESVLQLAG